MSDVGGRLHRKLKLPSTYDSTYVLLSRMLTQIRARNNLIGLSVCYGLKVPSPTPNPRMFKIAKYSASGTIRWAEIWHGRNACTYHLVSSAHVLAQFPPHLRII
ncbi:hypothetical protein M378DRAFT_162598 [Amanita muscaria Koide BX008]|uniref:Uncharacterized protein n=1 Tax=Amanita muscaria (strain Koide BX008) TaxID=946122 RepID=A0A0C2X8G6_AMAMK|nr:hypothetical protein M378DRAFT_162598 [Amanita muscaria Koide BX008]